MHPIARERTIFERIRLVRGVVQVLFRKLVLVDDERAAFFEIRQIHFQRGRVHGHQNVWLVARRANVLTRKIQLKAADARKAAGRGANLGGKVRERRDIVTDNRRRVRELRAR